MYDAIVVGARCAGSPTAMLLARKGYRVLLLDRAKFPSNMPISTHLVHQPGIALEAAVPRLAEVTENILHHDNGRIHHQAKIDRPH